MPNKKCASCGERYVQGTKNMSFFSFPKDTSLKEKWFKALNLPNSSAKYLWVCERHFTQDCFPEMIFGSLKLKSGSIPHLCDLVENTSLGSQTNKYISDSPPNCERISKGTQTNKCISDSPPNGEGIAQANQTNKCISDSPPNSEDISQEINGTDRTINSTSSSHCSPPSSPQPSLMEVTVLEAKFDGTSLSLMGFTPKTKYKNTKKKYRYFGDFKDEEFPTKVSKALFIAEKTILQLRQKLKNVSQQNRRLCKKVEKLKSLL